MQAVNSLILCFAQACFFNSFDLVALTAKGPRASAAPSSAHPLGDRGLALVVVFTA